MELTEGVRKVISFTADLLKGSALRQFKARVVDALGRGGQRKAEKELNWNRGTIRKGAHEARTGIECVDGRRGNQRFGVRQQFPDLASDIEQIVGCWSQTDPRFKTVRRYCRLTVSEVVTRLMKDKGYKATELPSNETIRKLMHALGYRQRKVQKAKPKKKVPETDAIFSLLHAVNQQADDSPNALRVCMDAKATVKIGELCRGGMSWIQLKSLDHDFEPDAVLTPIDILLPEHDELHFYFVRGSATSDAYADALDHFWKTNGHRFPDVALLVLNQDNGPEVQSRRSQFMARITEFADTTNLSVQLAYYPPYHSKYNPAERPWAILENHWRGDLLDTTAAAIGHARAMTWKGEHPIVVDWLDRTYEKGKKLTQQAMQAIEDRIRRVPLLPKWFVSIAPVSAHT